MDLIKDWENFCTGSKEFPASHFYTLLHGNIDSEAIERIFAFFEDKELLKSRLSKYFQPKQTVDNKSLLELTRKDIQQKRILCQKLGDIELSSLLENPKYSFSEESFFKSLQLKDDISHLWLMDFIGDHMVRRRKESIVVKSLLEAFYGLTTNYNLVWFLGKPLYSEAGFDPDCYFDIWINNGDYVVAQTEVFIVNRSSNL